MQQRIGRLRIGIALEPLFKDDDRLVELSQGYSRLSQKIEREVRMERIEPLAQGSNGNGALVVE